MIASGEEQVVVVTGAGGGMGVAYVPATRGVMQLRERLVAPWGERGGGSRRSLQG